MPRLPRGVEVRAAPSDRTGDSYATIWATAAWASGSERARTVIPATKAGRVRQ